MQEDNSVAVKIAGGLLIASVPFFLAQAAVATVFGFFEQTVGVPPQIVMVWLAFLCILFTPTLWLWLARGQARLPIVFGILTMLSVAIGQAEDFGFEEFRRLMQVATGLAVYIVTVICVRQSARFKTVLMVLIATASASALLALAEIILGFRVSWSGYSGLAEGVPVGFEYSPVPFAYAQVIPSAIAATAILSKVRSKALSPIWLMWFMAAVGFGALVASASRSGTMGVILGTFVGVVLMGRNRDSTRVIFGALAAVSALAILALTSDVFGYFWKGGVSSDARLGATLLAYFPIIAVNPLGLPLDADFFSELLRAESILKIRLSDNVAVSGLAQAPHHFVLTAALYYGWIAAIALVVIYGQAFLLSLRALRTLPFQSEERPLVIALFAGTAGLIVHSFFHNSSLVQGEMRGWIALGLMNGVSIAVLHRSTSRSSENFDGQPNDLSGGVEHSFP